MNTRTNKQLTQTEIAHIYDDLFNEQGRLRDSDAFYSWILKKLGPTPGTKLLDIACGEGLLVAAARTKGVECTGIDLSTQGILRAKKRLGKPVVAIANGEYLPYTNRSFDFVTNIGSLEHFINPLAGLQEMKRILKPDGKAAIFLPNSFYLADIIWQVWRTGYSVSHKQPLERFASFREWWDYLEIGGFRVKKAYKYNFCFPRSKSDVQWYMMHPRKILNLMIAPVIPFNLSNHFLYICEPAS